MWCFTDVNKEKIPQFRTSHFGVVCLDEELELEVYWEPDKNFHKEVSKLHFSQFLIYYKVFPVVRQLWLSRF